jgi:Domain of unknown function (DUF3291)
MTYHLAQANIARMRSHPGTQVMAGLVARIDEMNLLAEQAQGFVWRLNSSEVTPDALCVFMEYFVPFEPERLFYNMSVWENVEDLRNYTYRTAHSQMLRDKERWIDHFDSAHLALWWIPTGHLPTIVESAERLKSIQLHGPTPYAFNFKQFFVKPTV